MALEWSWRTVPCLPADLLGFCGGRGNCRVREGLGDDVAYVLHESRVDLQLHPRSRHDSAHRVVLGGDQFLEIGCPYHSEIAQLSPLAALVCCDAHLPDLPREGIKSVAERLRTGLDLLPSTMMDA